jgi:hypothetical protein
VRLIFDRRGKFATPWPVPHQGLITEGATPSLHIDYKWSKIKQYHKLGQALRTETTINDSREFGIGRRLCNLPALREVASPPPDVSLRSNKPTPIPTWAEDAFARMNRPAVVDGQRGPALRFGEPARSPCRW